MTMEMRDDTIDRGPVGPSIDDGLMAAFAAGTTGPATGLLAAAQASLNPQARERLAFYEAVGGSLMDGLEPAEMSDDLLDRVMGALDDDTDEGDAADDLRVATRSAGLRSDGAPFLPTPVMEAVGGAPENIQWHPVMRGLEECVLPVEEDGARTKLLRIQPGASMPRHTHHGSELTLVLRGAFTDSSGRYGPGDLAVCDDSVDHQPVADMGEPCICLVVMDAPLRLTGAVGRFLNPFVKF